MVNSRCPDLVLFLEPTRMGLSRMSPLGYTRPQTRLVTGNFTNPALAT